MTGNDPIEFAISGKARSEGCELPRRLLEFDPVIPSRPQRKVRLLMSLNPPPRPLIDPLNIDLVLSKMARSVAEGRRPGVPLRLVGVRTRGVPIALRIAEHLVNLIGEAVPVGAIDITLYRDDLGQGLRWPVLHGTDIPFNVDGAEIILVDDVLFTGRTVRAALNIVCDLGRPAAIRLAVLVDRGFRELPIRADVVGIEAETLRTDRVRVRVKPLDPSDEILVVPAN